jgi:predicted O-methyltransferase YrrM
MRFARWLWARLVPIEQRDTWITERRSPWGSPFNGQTGRKAVFEAIISLQKPNLIVETGTFLGSTSEALAGANVPVVTIEADRRNYGFARPRLRNFEASK